MLSITLSLFIGISETCPSKDIVSLKNTYPNAVQAAGHTAVIIPHSDNLEILRKTIKPLDMVILTGGEDVSPKYYDEKPHPMLEKINNRRDKFDLALIKACQLEKKPIVGICRGMQILNIAFGGSLYQDIPSQYVPANGQKLVPHRRKLTKDKNGPVKHNVIFNKDSQVAKILKTETMLIYSHHHQAIKKIAPGFKVTATAPDGIIEAFEHETLPIFGFQFHPEPIASGKVKGKYDYDLHLNMFKKLPTLIKSKTY